MIIYNTTFHLEDSIHDQCIEYLKSIYVPQALKGGQLTDPRLALIHSQHEESGVSYSLQFKVKDMETLEIWFEHHGGMVQEGLVSQFGQQACGFMTLLEEIEL